MITAAHICDAIGRKKLSEKLGVGRTAISNAAVDGRFPAKWFIVIQSLCSDIGQECPQYLFSFVSPSGSEQSEDEGFSPPQEAAE